MRQTWVMNRESYVPPPPPGHETPKSPLQSPGSAARFANLHTSDFSGGNFSTGNSSDYLKTNTLGSLPPPTSPLNYPPVDKVDKSDWGSDFDVKAKKKSGHNKKGACILLVGIAVVLIGLAAASLFVTGVVGAEASEVTKAPTTAVPTTSPIASPTESPSKSPTPAPTRNPTPSPTNAPTTTARPFPERVFDNANDMIQLTFLQGENANSFLVQETVAAARRWNQIVAGTSAKVVASNIPVDVCGAVGGTFVFPAVFNLNRLLIVISFDTLDSFDICGFTNFPLVAFMRFNQNFFLTNADILANPNLLKTIFQHRIAHMLGFGFLWPRAVQDTIVANPPAGTALIRNPIFNNGVFNPNLRPNFAGTRAATEFGRQLAPVQAGINRVNVEDGVGFPDSTVLTFGNQLADNLIRKVDVHWDLDLFRGEMMLAVTEVSNAVAPISLITVLSLQDMGYVVNTNLADRYTLNINGALPGRPELSHTISADGGAVLHLDGAIDLN